MHDLLSSEGALPRALPHFMHTWQTPGGGGVPRVHVSQIRQWGKLGNGTGYQERQLDANNKGGRT